MTSLLTFLLKSSVAFTVLYLLYVLFFRSTTFHKANRLYLVFLILFSVISPFAEFKFFAGSNPAVSVDAWIENLTPLQEGFAFDAEPQSALRTVKISFIQILLTIYLLVVFGMAIGFVIRLVPMWRLKSIIRQREKHSNNVFYSEACETPFSFLKWIFLPSDCQESADKELIIRHELVHVNQLHTLDILLVELYRIVFWFNPFVILHLRSLKTVHEYLADAAVANNKAEKVNYLQLLAKEVAYKHVCQLSSSFYWLTLKKRINMITKNKTSKLRFVNYLLIVPLAMFLIQSFSISGNEAVIVDKVISESKDNVPGIVPINSKDISQASGFGMRMHPIKKVEMMHNGVDFSAAMGTPVMATADGAVVKAEFKEPGKGYGKVIIVKHGETYSSLYAQLSEIKVKVGDIVEQGQVIGLVGSSGMSTGPHLHYEVRKNGDPVDPADYFGEN